MRTGSNPPVRYPYDGDGEKDINARRLFNVGIISAESLLIGFWYSCPLFILSREDNFPLLATFENANDYPETETLPGQ